MLFFCLIEISLALLTKPEACRTSCYLEKAWKTTEMFWPPSLTFNVYDPFLRPLGMKRKSNFFNAEAKATKVWLLQKIIWEQFGVRSHCSSNLMLPWQPYFDRLFSQNCEIYSFIWKLLKILKVLEKARNPKWRIQDGLHFKIMTQFSRHQVMLQTTKETFLNALSTFEVSMPQP